MRKLLISAAALAFLAAPALAQPEAPGSRGKAMVGHPQAQQAPRAPAPRAAAPHAAPAAGPRNFEHGNRGAQPVPQQPRGNDMRGGRDGNPGRDNRGNDHSRGNDNRPGFGNRPDNRPDFGNRPGNGFGNRPGNGVGNRPGNFGGPRHDFSNFRDFHRGFNAQRRFQAPNYRRPAGWYAHRWTFGEMLPSLFWARDYWLSDYQIYDLPPPPYGAVWVRVGNDALLIDQDSGEVITVEYDIFY